MPKDNKKNIWDKIFQTFEDQHKKISKNDSLKVLLSASLCKFFILSPCKK